MMRGVIAIWIPRRIGVVEFPKGGVVHPALLSGPARQRDQADRISYPLPPSA